MGGPVLRRHRGRKHGLPWGRRTDSCCFFHSDPISQGAPAAGPRRRLEPSRGAVLARRQCSGTGHLSWCWHLSPGSSRQGRAEKGLHPWQAQVTSASVGCGVGSLCQRACGRGPADSSVCDEGNGAAQGQEKSSLTRSPRHAPMAVLPGLGGNVATEGNLASAGTRGLWFVISLLSRNTARSVVFRHFSTGYSCLGVSPKGPAWGRTEAQGGDWHPACLCPAPGPQFPHCRVALLAA